MAVIAEGVALGIAPEGPRAVSSRRSATPTGTSGSPTSTSARSCRRAAQQRLQQLGIEATIAEKNIGYELRCADPIPYDMEYTRDLGYCAAKCLLAGCTASMVSMQAGHFVADPVRGADGSRHRRARGAHGRHPLDPLRDRPALHDPAPARRLRGPRRVLARLAKTAGLSGEEFSRQFEYLIEDEPPPPHELEDGTIREPSTGTRGR